MEQQSALLMDLLEGEVLGDTVGDPDGSKLGEEVGVSLLGVELSSKLGVAIGSTAGPSRWGMHSVPLMN